MPTHPTSGPPPPCGSTGRPRCPVPPGVAVRSAPSSAPASARCLGARATLPTSLSRYEQGSTSFRASRTPPHPVPQGLANVRTGFTVRNPTMPALLAPVSGDKAFVHVELSTLRSSGLSSPAVALRVPPSPSGISGAASPMEPLSRNLNVAVLQPQGGQDDSGGLESSRTSSAALDADPLLRCQRNSSSSSVDLRRQFSPAGPAACRHLALQQRAFKRLGRSGGAAQESQDPAEHGTILAAELRQMAALRPRHTGPPSPAPKVCAYGPRTPSSDLAATTPPATTNSSATVSSKPPQPGAGPPPVTLINPLPESEVPESCRSSKPASRTRTRVVAPQPARSPSAQPSPSRTARQLSPTSQAPASLQNTPQAPGTRQLLALGSPARPPPRVVSPAPITRSLSARSSVDPSRRDGTVSPPVNARTPAVLWSPPLAPMSPAWSTPRTPQTVHVPCRVTGYSPVVSLREGSPARTPQEAEPQTVEALRMVCSPPWCNSGTNSPSVPTPPNRAVTASVRSVTPPARPLRSGTPPPRCNGGGSGSAVAVGQTEATKSSASSCRVAASPQPALVSGVQAATPPAGHPQLQGQRSPPMRRPSPVAWDGSPLARVRGALGSVSSPRLDPSRSPLPGGCRSTVPGTPGSLAGCSQPSPRLTLRQPPPLGLATGAPPPRAVLTPRTPGREACQTQAEEEQRRGRQPVQQWKAAVPSQGDAGPDPLPPPRLNNTGTARQRAAGATASKSPKPKPSSASDVLNGSGIGGADAVAEAVAAAVPGARKPPSKLIKLQLGDKSPRYDGAGHLQVKQYTSPLSAGQKAPRECIGASAAEEPTLYTL